jgi:hypothetical protein
MLREPGRGICRRLCVLAIAFALTMDGRLVYAQAQDDGGVSSDGGGQEVLESIFVPYLAHAPFSLTLTAEWSRPMNNGGTFTTANSRPIKRDSAGRIYQERWLMSPKGSNIPSRISAIQIADPVEHTAYQCSPGQKICVLLTLEDSVTAQFDPAPFKPGPLKDNKGDVKGTRSHEDLGAQFFAGMPVHEYRDTTTVNAGVMGNDLPMSTARQYRFSPELGFNLTSIVEAPQIGRQTFTVTEITTSEPDPSFFQPPQGYKVVDRRVVQRNSTISVEGSHGDFFRKVFESLALG